MNSTAPMRSRSRRVVAATDVTVFGVALAAQSLVVLAISIAAVVALQLFLNGTRTGRCMQATAQNPTVARLLGIPVERMILYTFLINAALVTLASILITPIYLAKFTNGEWLGLYAFIAAIIGGFNQVRGAIVGGAVAGRDRQFRRRLSVLAIPNGDTAADPHRGDPGPAAGPARPGRGAHRMSGGRRMFLRPRRSSLSPHFSWPRRSRSSPTASSFSACGR